MPNFPLVVPDVNVLVSGTTTSQTPPSQILQAWRDGQIEIATSLPILEDLSRVLRYPRVVELTKMNDGEQTEYITTLQASAIVVPGTISVQVSSDPDDNKLFSCAIEAEADYIISGDKKHVLSIGEYQGIKTITPANFVKDVLGK